MVRSTLPQWRLMATNLLANVWGVAPRLRGCGNVVGASGRSAVFTVPVLMNPCVAIGTLLLIRRSLGGGPRSDNWPQSQSRLALLKGCVGVPHTLQS